MGKRPANPSHDEKVAIATVGSRLTNRIRFGSDEEIGDLFL